MINPVHNRKFGNDLDRAARIVVVGAGGFAREVVEWLTASWPERTNQVAGFLASEGDSVRTSVGCLPVLGDPITFLPAEGDRLLLAIGIPGVRRRIAESLVARGGEFLTLVHPTAIVATTAIVGNGSIVCPFAVLSASSHLGKYVLVNYYASLGHDSCIGDFSVMSPYATLGGHAVAEEEVFLGLHAVIGPRRRLGRGSKVSAGSCLLHDTPPESLVFGVPGRIAPRLDASID